MAREPAFATVVNSELTVEFLKKITNVREREVSADVSFSSSILFLQPNTDAKHILLKNYVTFVSRNM